VLFEAHERLAELEGESLAKLAQLETELGAVRAERDELLEGRRQVDEEVNTLRRAVMQQQQESQNRQSMLESKIMELETLTRTVPKGKFWFSFIFLLLTTIKNVTEESFAVGDNARWYLILVKLTGKRSIFRCVA
jgi:DNA repair exonuclease SbcCD ATPase subunit